MTLLEYALAYAARGYEVLPLNGKVPLTRCGFKDATADADTVREWWTKWPDANVGCRPPEDIIIIDVDPRNGGKLEDLGGYPRGPLRLPVVPPHADGRRIIRRL